MIEWQPIKTAPRDGTNILLAWGQDGVSQGHYVHGLPRPWKFIDTNDGITWLINHAVDGPGGPSHWMPMPKWVRPTPGVQGAAPITRQEFFRCVSRLAELWADEQADHFNAECNALADALGLSGKDGGTNG